MGFVPTGAGEHLFLRIKKQNLNTEDVAKQLARLLNKPSKLISYAGLKDKHAVTTQWFSIHCPGEDLPHADHLSGEGWQVIESTRHLKKLKNGGIARNQFTLMIRHIKARDELEQRLTLINTLGVPNYFGPQRFGHLGQNLIKAEKMLLHGFRVKDRFLRGIYYSTARSYLFNCILAKRVALQNWNKALSGDVLQLSGSHSIFPIEVPDETIHSRVATHDVSPASVLYGKGKELASLEALQIQQEVLHDFSSWCDALIAHGLEKAYRAHVLIPEQLQWKWAEDALTLSFLLPPGTFATSILRELIYEPSDLP